MVHVQYISIDNLVITTPLKKQYSRPLVMLCEISCISCWGKLSLRCWAFAWLNDCANGDEADFTFVQTQQTQSLYFFNLTFFQFKSESTTSRSRSNVIKYCISLILFFILEYTSSPFLFTDYPLYFFCLQFTAQTVI